MDLKNKIALVTGGSSGIGKAICEALAREGCDVVFTYNSHKSGAEETIKIDKKKITGLQVDFHDENEMQHLFNTIKEKYGKLDIFVNNAGINSPRGLFETSDWKEIFQIDLFAPVFCTGKAVDLMNNNGRILNVTSIYGDGKACYKGIAPYGAAKAALNHYTQMLAKNLAPGILVNAIAPGYVRTPLWKNTSDSEFEVAGKEQLIERMIKPNEVAEMALAIIKNDAMTGEIVIIDGGLSLKTI